MAKIQKDNQGYYYAIVDGQIVRPYHRTTTFNEGDDVIAKQCAGTPCYGVGKNDTCGRGVYLEAWMSTGVTREMRESDDPEVQELARVNEEFYARVKPDYPIAEGEYFSFSDVKKKHRVLVENKDTVILRAMREDND